MVGDLTAGGMPDGEKLCGECSGARDPMVVAAELHEEEDEDAAGGADGRDVNQVLDVSVPCSVIFSAASAVEGGGGRWRREGVVHCKSGEFLRQNLGVLSVEIEGYGFRLNGGIALN